MPIDFYIYSIAASGLFVFLTLFIIGFVVRYNQRQKEFEVEKRSMELAFQNEAARAELELSEQLLTKISQEIHDNIGASLTLAKMQLAIVDDVSYVTKSKRTSEILTRAIADLRNLSKSINGLYILEQGIENAVMREIELINESGLVEAQFVAHGDNMKLSSQMEVILFRAIQESLNNANKHAKASIITVTFGQNPLEWLFMIEDNGIGMQMDVIAKSVGLNSLKARMQAIGGRLQIDSAPGLGTKIYCFLPK